MPKFIVDEVMKKGWYNPLWAYWFVHCCGLAYRKADQIHHICTNFWGMTHAEFFDDPVTDTQAFGMYNSDIVVICFRGTESIMDWKTNINFQRTGPFKDKDIKVHRGFNAALISIFPTVKDFIQLARKDNPKKHLFITGHSLGGALANLCYAYLTLPHDPTAMISTHLNRISGGLLKAKDLDLLTQHSMEYEEKRMDKENLEKEVSQNKKKIKEEKKQQKEKDERKTQEGGDESPKVNNKSLKKGKEKIKKLDKKIAMRKAVLTDKIKNFNLEDFQLKWSKTDVTAVYTFGQPRVGNYKLKHVLNSQNSETDFFRVTNHLDVVPTIPKGFCHCGSQVFISYDDRFVIGSSSEAKKLRRQLKQTFNSQKWGRKTKTFAKNKQQSLLDHVTASYTQPIINHYESSLKLTRSLGSAGTIVCSPNTVSKKQSGTKRSRSESKTKSIVQQRLEQSEAKERHQIQTLKSLMTERSSQIQFPES